MSKEDESVTRYDPSSMMRVDFGIEELGDDMTLTDFSEYHISEIRRRARGKRICISLISLFAIAGITLGITMGISKSGKNTSKLSSDLSSKCSPNAVSTRNGFDDCKELCAQADCCRLPEDDPRSCAKERADTCESFDTYCAVLSFDYDNNGKVEVVEYVEVTPADSSISDVCDWNKIASADGFFACRDACAPGNCCYEAIETCKVTNPEICSDYAACNILHVQQMVNIPPALTDIADLCLPDSLDDPEGYKMCKNACDPGECCLEPIEACKVENPDICSDYNVCEILHGTPKSHPSSIESQIVTKCNTNALACDDDVQECKDLCQPAACCFTSNEEDSCNTPENEEWCSQYAACQLLDHIDDDGISNHEEAKDAVQNACSDTSSSGLARCSNVCFPARCCFDETLDCNGSGMDNLRCSHYEACGILYHHDKNPNTSVKPNPTATQTDRDSMLGLAEHISKVCSGESIQNFDGFDECYDLCEDNLCCFAEEDEQNCVKDHGERCVVYAACDNIVHGEYAPKPEDQINQASGNDSAEKSKSFHEELSEKCQEGNINSLEGFNECLDVCQAHLCCSSTDKRENCYNDHPNECDDYAPCSSLTKHGVLLDKAIDEDSVNGVCDVALIRTSEGLTECQSVCAEHLCCFAPMGTKSNCIDTLGKEECMKYQSCINLTLTTKKAVGVRDSEPMDSFSEADPESFDIKIPEQDSLAFSCSEEHIEEAGETECDEMCNGRSCCFQDGPGNCRVTDKEFCTDADMFCNKDSS